MNGEINRIIKERSKNTTISQYILKSIDYFRSRNVGYSIRLCDKIADLLLQEKNLAFTSSDEGSYFSLSDREVSFDKKVIEKNRFSTFIHEITHAFHGIQYSWQIPSEYDEERKRIISNNDFISKIRDLMKYIIESKQRIINEAIARRRMRLNFSKTNNCISIENNLNNEIKIISNINKDIKIINNKDVSLHEMFLLSEQLNKDFESLVDNIEYGEVDQKFHVLSAMEGMIDSLLLGELHKGYGNNCIYLQGYGHSKDYFTKDSKNSFIELIADFSVLTAYNDSMLLEIMKLILGNEIYEMLNSSLNALLDINDLIAKKRK